MQKEITHFELQKCSPITFSGRTPCYDPTHEMDAAGHVQSLHVTEAVSDHRLVYRKSIFDQALKQSDEWYPGGGMG
jgi:hypothetical protein